METHLNKIRIQKSWASNRHHAHSLIITILLLSILAFKSNAINCVNTSGSIHVLTSGELAHPWGDVTLGGIAPGYDPHGNQAYDTSIEIPSGLTLTIDGISNMTFAKDAFIIVDNGAHLILNNTIISNLPSAICSPQHLWGGIIVHGDVFSSQNSGTGSVVMTNSGIWFANEGVQLGDGGYIDNGGIIKASYCNFIDCHRSVKFLSYSQSNQSYFTGCSFLCDKILPDVGTDLYAGVTMDDVGTIIFLGCTFWNSETTQTGTNRGAGIIAIDANFLIDQDVTCSGGIPTDWRACPEGCTYPYPHTGPCQFEQLTIGIQNTEPFSSGDIAPNLSVLHSEFVDNLTDIQDNTGQYTFIKGNDFKITSHFPDFSGGNAHIAIQEILSNKIDISDNEFDADVPYYDGNLTGVEIQNCGTNDSRIYHNFFKFDVYALFPTLSTDIFYTGIHALGENGSLQINCNQFFILPTNRLHTYWDPGVSFTHLRDWLIEYDPGAGSSSHNIILPSQTAGGLAAGNYFSDIDSFSSYVFTSFGFTFNYNWKNIVIIDNPSATIPFTNLDYFNFFQIGPPPFTSGDVPPFFNDPSGIITLNAVGTHNVCGSSDCANYYASDPVGKFVFHKNNKDNTVIVFPNPTNSYLNISYRFPTLESKNSGDQLPYLEIYNTTGQNCYRQNMDAAEQLINIDISSWANGIYYYKFVTVMGGNLQQGKFIIQK